MEQLPKTVTLLGLLALTTLARAHGATPDNLPNDGVPLDWVPQPVEIEAGATRKVLTTDSANGFRRSFRLYVPAEYDPSKFYPLVVALHGAMATARIFEDQSALSAAADRHGFFVVNSGDSLPISAPRSVNCPPNSGGARG